MNRSPNTLPTLLLVEDDPVSAVFLRDAAAALPAEVDAAGSIAEAMAAASLRRHDLYLIDANLPDGRGEVLLQELRRRGLIAPALAHTAARDTAIRERLLAAGFVDMVSKPLGVAELHAALRPHLAIAPPTCGKQPNWDDDAALAALGGQRAHVDALRGLFLKELPGQRQRIEAAAAGGDEAAIREELHRLVASCGFVGAARLAAAVRELQSVPLDAQAFQRLDFAMDDLLGPA
ncbi:response regulator [Thermomonas sp. HDW16]|uniref:response regulator n=1 Tax=Thermomonas sp. HDW16 TaxID=2714945 RepID=UPI00140D524B|nr:response regulator [Thermomonas sp. HDW16]QIL20978.1 response regulator [Thermomonas sp. HDW16]